MFFTFLKSIFKKLKQRLNNFLTENLWNFSLFLKKIKLKTKSESFENSFLDLENLILYKNNEEKVSSIIDKIYLDCKDYYPINYTTKTLQFKAILIESSNLTEFLPIGILLVMHKIFLDIEASKIRLFPQEFINVTVEVVFYDSNLDFYFTKTIYSCNESSKFFFSNIKLIKTKIILNLLDLFNLYEIHKILSLKIIVF